MPDFNVLEALGFPPLPGEGVEKRSVHLEALRAAVVSLREVDGREHDSRRSPRRAEWIAATVEAAGRGLRIPLEPFESLERGEYSGDSGGLLDADLAVARWFRRCAMLRVTAVAAVVRSVLVAGVDAESGGGTEGRDRNGSTNSNGHGLTAVAATRGDGNVLDGEEVVPALSSLLDARPGGALCSVVLDLVPLLCTERASPASGTSSEWTSPRIARAARSLLGFLLSSEPGDAKHELRARFANVEEVFSECGGFIGGVGGGDDDDVDDDDDGYNDDVGASDHKMPLDKRQMQRLDALLPSIVAAVRPSLLGHERALAVAKDSLSSSGSEAPLLSSAMGMYAPRPKHTPPSLPPSLPPFLSLSLSLSHTHTHLATLLSSSLRARRPEREVWPFRCALRSGLGAAQRAERSFYSSATAR